MVCADLAEGTFKENAEIAKEVADRAPFGEWIEDESRRLEELGGGSFTLETLMSAADALKLQVTYACCSQSGLHIPFSLNLCRLSVAPHHYQMACIWQHAMYQAATSR